MSTRIGDFFHREEWKKSKRERVKVYVIVCEALIAVLLVSGSLLDIIFQLVFCAKIQDIILEWVHRVMCTILLNFVDGISKLIPDIEAAQPRCSSGIESLCLLQNAIKKARLLVQYCSESTKLYLAITGDAIVSRCRRIRNLLEQSLGQLQTMVPVALELEISQIIEDLRYAVFVMDSAEEEAGQVMRALLQKDKSRSDLAENSEIEALQFASSRLCLLSWKDLLIEKRSIKKLLDTVTDSDPTKMMILKYLLYLLKKHDKVIVRDQTENPVVLNNGSFLAANSHEESVESRVLHMESQLEYELDGAQRDMLRGPILPEEFKCPLSSRLMYDPVVIASGQTFERIYIQKWFNEGNDTCPVTRMKLAHFSLTPNSVIRDLISKWGSEHGITAFDPSIQSSVFGSSETSLCSITSTSSSLKDDNFVEPLFRFLKDSFKMRDVKAQKAGAQLFSTYLSTIRDVIPYHAVLTAILKTLNAENRRFHGSLAGNCIVILENLCGIEGAKGIRYCQLVMDEGIIPALVTVSINGNDRGKVVALELLRLLRDINCEEQHCSGLDVIASDDSYRPTSEEKKISSKRTGLIRGKMGFFSRKKK
ncbi:hypothetical protein Nepgr_027029 [Nepenthes gracilis]|uniref:RING-type E3 ubiquitin transferase n=1 Tax=Nepenthes gracilis TaxID=150966 RepID=A0AAD3Y352_NEPGR|nr:hypothetical protein Nepgr_027029 [Nepenthes gracilis]